MSREDIRKLLGGYATDTLSADERRALFEAALEDQELFDELGKEQALREALQEPAARDQLLRALGPRRPPPAARVWRWFRSPVGLAVAGAMTALIIVAGVIVLRQTKQEMRTEALMTMVRQAEALSTPAPAPEPAARSASAQPFKKAVTRRTASQPPATATAQEIASAPQMAPAPLPPPVAPAAQAQMAFAKQKSAKIARTSVDVIEGTPAVPYSLLLRGADGEYAAASPGQVFHAGDAIRVRVRPTANGYVYLWQRNPAGGLDLVSSQPVEKGQAYEIPASGALESSEAGRKQLLLMVSTAPMETGLAGAVRQEAAQPAMVEINLEYR